MQSWRRGRPTKGGQGDAGARADKETLKAARNNRAYEFSSGELAEQAPRGKKINSFKAFGEPVVNPFQQLDGLPLAALIGP